MCVSSLVYPQSKQRSGGQEKDILYNRSRLSDLRHRKHLACQFRKLELIHFPNYNELCTNEDQGLIGSNLREGQRQGPETTAEVGERENHDEEIEGASSGFAFPAQTNNCSGEEEMIGGVVTCEGMMAKVRKPDYDKTKVSGTSSYDSELATESVSDPVELERRRLKPPDITICDLSATRSSLNIVAKALTMLSTTGFGVHGGKVQAEMLEWEPRTINGSLLSPFVNSRRKVMHIGQQRFDIPITRP